jgi:hypothetical protein
VRTSWPSFFAETPRIVVSFKFGHVVGYSALRALLVRVLSAPPVVQAAWPFGGETMRVDLVLKSDRCTFGYAAAKGGKIRFIHSALDDGLVLLPNQVPVMVNRGGQAVFYRRQPRMQSLPSQ